MNPNCFSSVNFDKYRHLIDGLFASAGELIICDAEGVPILTSSDMDRSELSHVMVSLKAQRLDAADSWEKVQVRKLNGNKRVYSLGMSTECDNPLGMLVLIVDHNSLFGTVNTLDKIEPLIANLATFIKSEYMLMHELNAVANELGERYEELNLLYEVDMSVQQVGDAHSSLRRILENCVAYLDVDMAFLSVPSKHIIVSYSGDGWPSSESQAIIEYANNVLYQKLKAIHSSIVLNEQAEVQEVCPGVSCKVLSSPIFGGDGQFDGILVTAKNRESHDYTNSDRNLLEVMAKRVMQVIQINYDTLTGLLNPAGYEDYVKKNLSTTFKAGSIHTMLDIDLDDFRVANEIFSYQVGDNLIKTVAAVIQEQVRDSDIVFRIGGDEFGVILENCPLESSVQIANKIRQAIKSLDFVWDNEQLETSATIGVVVVDANMDNSAHILRELELVRDAAKDLGKNSVHVFQREGGELVRRKAEMHWVTRIKAALREERFVLYAQPIVPIQGNTVAHHFEILLRLHDEHGTILAPNDFIPAAEHYHLMPDIDRWVVNQTLTMLSEQSNRDSGRQIKVAINLSGQSVGNDIFLEFLLEQLSHVDFPLENICFEVTESAAITHLAEAQHFMMTLKKKGCQFSLDDFGTGLSSFAYLKHLPVDYLKIDGCFVKDIIDDPISEAMVAAISQVGHVMDLKIIAEYVENDAIRDRLRKLCVDYAQGYGVGKPRPFADQLEEISV